MEPRQSGSVSSSSSMDNWWPVPLWGMPLCMYIPHEQSCLSLIPEWWSQPATWSGSDHMVPLVPVLDCCHYCPHHVKVGSLELFQEVHQQQSWGSSSQLAIVSKLKQEPSLVQCFHLSGSVVLHYIRGYAICHMAYDGLQGITPPVLQLPALLQRHQVWPRCDLLVLALWPQPSGHNSTSAAGPPSRQSPVWSGEIYSTGHTMSLCILSIVQVCSDPCCVGNSKSIGNQGRWPNIPLRGKLKMEKYSLYSTRMVVWAVWFPVMYACMNWVKWSTTTNTFFTTGFLLVATVTSIPR